MHSYICMNKRLYLARKSKEDPEIKGKCDFYCRYYRKQNLEFNNIFGTNTNSIPINL